MILESIDFRRIRPIDGDIKKGFEELCSQLARNETPSSAEFIRKGTPDAGVECYSVFEDKTEWGWQAKFFPDSDSLDWSQIDKSVKKALKKHQKLVCYYICLPQNLPDGRIDNKRA